MPFLCRLICICVGASLLMQPLHCPVLCPQALKNSQTLYNMTGGKHHDGASAAGSRVSSACPTGYTSKTSVSEGLSDSYQVE
jgi:hypothetical protein